MLGYEPPEPKLWKALLGAGLITFPFSYVADVAIFGHRPGWIYLVVASVLTVLLGRQLYRKGPAGLHRIPIGASMSKIFGGASWQPPPKREKPDSDPA